MRFVKTFKGYEDRTMQLDETVNSWIARNKVQVLEIKTALSHEHGGRGASGDLLYTVLYEADAPIQEAGKNASGL